MLRQRDRGAEQQKHTGAERAKREERIERVYTERTERISRAARRERRKRSEKGEREGRAERAEAEERIEEPKPRGSRSPEPRAGPRAAQSPWARPVDCYWALGFGLWGGLWALAERMENSKRRRKRRQRTERRERRQRGERKERREEKSLQNRKVVHTQRTRAHACRRERTERRV